MKQSRDLIWTVLLVSLTLVSMIALTPRLLRDSAQGPNWNIRRGGMARPRTS
ncbi:hypothetical protein [Deinococcus radiophilus]|uniref:hypothetical protein n=1 Tax=Deinococcus radiophilus TaxID=32062 RepID=UPI0036166339